MPAATDRPGRWVEVALALASVLLVGTNATPTRAETGVSRGEALYANHCVACHTCAAHTRRDPLVKNMGELLQQVDRWQTNQKLDWTSEERNAVVEYLNRSFYKF